MKRLSNLVVFAFAAVHLDSAPVLPARGQATNQILLADFESNNWGAWRVTGEAFGPAPAAGTLTNQQQVTNFLGHRLVNSFVGGDGSTGTLTSPEFAITLPYLNFLIGGGNHPGKVGVNLVVDGKIVQSATGPESERLHWHTWNLFPVLRKKARLEIVDAHAGGWGHVTVDQINLSDRPAVPPYFNDAITSAMTSVAEATPRAQLDPTRPLYHFLAPANWMNDPNGPFYLRGYYHIYYQHNPYGDEWGHMHWGHARSRDLVFWKQMPISLWPSRELGEEHVFSGCVTTNSRGQPMAFYTSIGFGKSASDYAEQWAAVGDSDASTFTKHPMNPILSEKLHGDVKVYDWRDPFVFRDQGRTFMVCGGNLNQAKGGQAVILLYEALSGELTNWSYRGVLFTHPDPSVKDLECPNFFKLGQRWVLIDSPYGKVEYFTGAFDAAAGTFTADTRGMMDYGDDYYAPNSMEDPRGRRVLWGWVRGFKPKRGWNGCLTLPRILTTDSEGRLLQAPAPELAKLRGHPFTIPTVVLDNATNAMENVRGDVMEIDAELERGTANSFGLRLRVSNDGTRAITVAYDGENLTAAGVQAKLERSGGGKNMKLHIFLDRSVMEIYANGTCCLTKVIYPGETDLGLGVFASGGTARIKSLKAWPLKSSALD